MEYIVSKINAVLWGIPVLSLILIIGIYFTVSSGFAQLRFFPHAVRTFLRCFKKKQHNGTSGYRALCTALAATVGTGNIAGVAGAIAIGGPGAVFWMWLCAVLGMVIKLAEVTLAQRYRIQNSVGEYVGGPMYMIQFGISDKYIFLAYLYAFFGVVAALGVGNATQVNTVVEGFRNMTSSFGIKIGDFGYLIIGGILIALVIRAFSFGVNGVGCWAEKLVPLASLAYIAMCLCVLILRYRQVPAAVSAIITGAFNPKSVTSGTIGSAFLTLRIGASRGVFTNEAGMGTASIVHASAEVDHPVEQGLMGIMEVYLDTILICTMTALVVLSSGAPIPYGTDPGIMLTLDAFAVVLGDWSRLLITGLVCIFAFATILGWGVYGMRCAQYLLGESIWKAYILFLACASILGVVLRTSVVWMIAEIINGLMAIPNLIVLLLLSPEFLRLLNTFTKDKAYSLK